MTTARNGQTATLLATGKVLVAGGIDANFNGLSSAELYDPISDTWFSAGSMLTVRWGQTDTLLNNGRVLVTGGRTTGPGNPTLSSAELYDPISNTWSSAGSMSTARWNHTATLLKNGRVLIVAGANPTLGHTSSSAQLYDPVTNTWSSAGSLTAARGFATATLLANGEVLVAGGTANGAVAGALSSAELYDPTSNSWSPAGSMVTGRWSATAMLLPSGRVLVAGGEDANSNDLSSAELYDPVSNTWSSAGSMANPRAYQTATLLKNGQVLVTGGRDANGNSLSSAELYDPTSNTWSSAGDMATPRWADTATLLNNGLVLVAGGFDGSSAVSSAELYDPGVGVLNLSQSTISVKPASIPTGGTATVSLTAKDAAGNQFTTGGLPFSFGLGAGTGSGTFSNLTDNHNGIYTATFTGTSVGPIVISATLNGQPVTSTLPTITISAASSATQFVVNIPGSSKIVAGNPFLVAVQAADSSGNPVANYSGPTSLTITPTPADPQITVPITSTLNASGLGFFLVNLKTAGAYTLTATAGTVSATSASFTVAPSDVSYFTLTSPAAATTGTSFPVTVTAFDHYGNVATGYSGTVQFTSTDPAAHLPAHYTFTTGPGMENGVHVFIVTFMSAGSRTITATDATSTNPTITGTSGLITTRGLTVTALTPTATGFIVTFSKPIVASDINLYGGAVANPIRNVTMVGNNTGPIFGPVNGIFVIDSSGTSATFKASSDWLQNIADQTDLLLPNDTWTVTLQSGTGTGSTANGFFDALGAPLDGGNNGGTADFVTTFTTANDGKPALTIPDFARGPDGSAPIKVPNGSAKGIPVTLAKAPAGTKDVVFTLHYNTALLMVTGAGTGDSSGTGSTFTAGTSANGAVTFTWHNGTGLSGDIVLGGIVANVPNSAANLYKAKDLMTMDGITVNGTALTLTSPAVHINAYFGDLSGDGQITGLDLAVAGNVAAGAPASPIGLSAYKLVDPGLIGDIGGDGSIDSAAISSLAGYLAHVATPSIPTPPAGLTITPGGPDPTLNLSKSQLSGGIANVSVLLDHPRPEGSTGMTEAVIGLSYDPRVLTVSAAGITLGSIPVSGSGWRLESVIDLVTGQIAIDLFSTTPISEVQGGSLVNVAFHTAPGANASTTAVQLDSAITPLGRWYSTEVADGDGKLVVSPGVDRVLIETDTNPAGLVRLPRVVAELAEPRHEKASPYSLPVPPFQVGTQPLLNALLYHRSPGQVAADKLFADMGRSTQSRADRGDRGHGDPG
jgi:N-acetylneuraminic acid mutarotase